MRGAPVDAIDNRGRTALMIAAELGRAEIVEALLARGADRTITDKSGKRAARPRARTRACARSSRGNEPTSYRRPAWYSRAGRDIVLRDREHQVGHAGIVAARAGAEVHRGLVEILLRLAGETRLGAFALIIRLMTTGASERGIGAQRPRGDIGRCRRLPQIGPALLGEIERQRHHVVALERLGEPRDMMSFLRAPLL